MARRLHAHGVCVHASVVVVVATLLLLLLLTTTTTTGGRVRADAVSTPLCHVVYGFANEQNDHIQLPIAHAPSAANAALVLAVHNYMMHASLTSTLSVRMNVTYYLDNGTRVSRLSDAGGLLVLTDVAAGRDVDVRFGRHGAGPPLPFSFYSYYANAAECYIAVDATRAFYAMLPRRVPSQSSNNNGGGEMVASTVYFSTALPPQDTAVAIYAITDFAHKQPVRVYDAHATTMPPSSAGGAAGGTVYASGDVVVARTRGSTLFFSVTLPPAPAAAATTMGGGGGSNGADDVFLIVYVERVERSGDGGAGGAGTPSSTTAPSAPSPSPSPHNKSTRSWLSTLLLLALVLAVVYVAMVSYYNYTRLGKTTFPEMLPHVEYARALVRCVTMACARLCGRRGGDGGGGVFGHDGYDEVEVRYNTHAYAT